MPNFIEKNEDSLKDKISLWTGVLGFMGMIICGYLFIANPGINNDTAIKLQDQRIQSQEQTINTLTKTQQNDTQEVKQAIKDVQNEVKDVEIALEKLSTIIEERIPAKK